MIPGEKDALLLRLHPVFTSVCFAACGLGLLLAGMDDQQLEAEKLLLSPDPLLGFQMRTVLTGAAILFFACSGFLAICRDRITHSVIALWLVWSCIVYVAGLNLLGKPCDAINMLAMKFRISTVAFSSWWIALMAVVLAGSLCQIAAEMKRLRQLKDAAYLDSWRKLRQRDRQA
jgi:hypothetical protein